MDFTANMLTYNNIMVDLETLGTQPGAAILSIGAVRFRLDGIYDSFHRIIDLDSSIEKGFTVERNTIRWWMEQKPEIRDPLFDIDDNSIFFNVEEVLVAFKDWVGPQAPVTLWGNGASFDLAILREAYNKVGFGFYDSYNDRCYRTMKYLYPEIKKEDNPNLHNALEDARNQAEYLIRLLKHHGEVEKFLGNFSSAAKIV